MNTGSSESVLASAAAPGSVAGAQAARLKAAAELKAKSDAAEFAATLLLAEEEAEKAEKASTQA